MTTWMEEAEIDRAVRTVELYAEDFHPYAAFLSDWRHTVKGLEGGWREGTPGASCACKLTDLVSQAARNAVFGGRMPTEAALRKAVSLVRTAAAEYGVEPPDLALPTPVTPSLPADPRSATEAQPQSGHRDRLWQADIDDFVGGAIHVGPSFEFDGRADGTDSDEDYTHVWDWDDFGRTLWSGTRDGTEYSVVELAGFDPPTVALRTEGETVGYYMDAMCWVDPPHRGKGLAVDLIRGGIALLDKVPNLNAVGFSEAGLAAHEAAHRESVREAILRGDLDDSHIPSGP